MSDAVRGTTFADRYCLDEEIGRGGMGTVWRATDTRLGRDVAVKLLTRPSDDTDDPVDKRFEREAKAVAALRSPHIVQIYDYGVEHDAPFMVMELLEGSSLKKRLYRRHRLELDEVVQLVRHVARALATAHEAGLVHRDLKPGNIYLVPDRDRELAKVLDFGIAKALTGPLSKEKLTNVGSVLGTPAYMSPEQVLTDPVDGRADLWSLGVVAFQAITGYRPFEGPAGEIVSQICTAPAPQCSKLRPDAPPEIDAFFAKALAKRPKDRFQEAMELSDELALAAGTGASSRTSSPSLEVRSSWLPAEPAAAPQATVSTVVDAGEETTVPAGDARAPLALAHTVVAPPAADRPSNPDAVLAPSPDGRPSATPASTPPWTDQPAEQTTGARLPLSWMLATLGAVALATILGVVLVGALSTDAEKPASTSEGAAPADSAPRPTAAPEPTDVEPAPVATPAEPHAPDPVEGAHGGSTSHDATAASRPPRPRSPAKPGAQPARPSRSQDLFDRPWIE
ncbi:MAG: protein kinase [Deltaproteobacteria bacterium]|jgi:serine/threonine-protein kinase|nr:protein kinase [Deltaproteobacteria bacterium]MBW2537052.1 protein kinase [Deltaproteobacteria bacterium]